MIFSVRRRLGLAKAAFAVLMVCGSSGLSQTPPLRASAPAAPAIDESEVVEVEVGSGRSLPRVLVVPNDDSAVAWAKEVAHLIGLPGIYAPVMLKPGAPAAGLVVRVSAANEGSSTRVEASSSRTEGSPHRRMVLFAGEARSLELARLADAILADLSGERSHLSGTLLFTDAATSGERRVRVSLASGVPVRDASPAGLAGFFARGADSGPGGVVYFAGARPGEMLRIYAEGKPDPVAVKIPGYLQTVSFSPDRLRAAVIAGSFEGGALYTGILEGTMKLVDTGPGIAIGPSFGPQGELAYAAGPPLGPLHVFVDGKPITGQGVWASAPAFCNEGAKRRIAYMVKQGASWSTVIHDLDSGGSHPVGEGLYPACSPDGRSVAVARSARGRSPGGIFLIGEDGIAAHRIREGEAVGLRWAPGPSLPPEG